MLIRNVSYLMTIHGIKNVTQLASRLEMHQSTLHRLLTGEVKDPSYSMLKTIANFFGRTATEIMECDLSENDGANPYIHPIDSEPKYQNFPSGIQVAIRDAYKEIVIREAKPIDSERMEAQTARLENLAENLVKGFSKLIEI
ncbi:helix-turn-helix transcriptional regulator [Xenorhabdus sp. TS4]|uniref:helix-turn-helix domain-containing protein n=1 Tax=Xenorhabdus sp. TS4 TaxID=1873483 RepID=UPI0016570589|nr:helix-turn-helix transcriptional regulator [Xenorhabdus sp. TS4]MBC8950230.1 transcriptional regulator [Xenorhabdus sp. TS4]